MRHVPSECAASLAMLSLGCITQTLDLRNLEEPVVLNGDPAVGGSDLERWTVIGRYHGTVTETVTGTSSGSGNSTRTTTLENDAQEQAFLEIGGHKNRAITSVQISVAAFALNLLTYIRAEVDIDAWGAVVELTPGEDVVEEAAVFEYMVEEVAVPEEVER